MTRPNAEGWRPISSAPKDGTDILLRGPTKKGHPRPPVVAARNPKAWNSSGWFAYDDVDAEIDIAPVEWMLIPPSSEPA